MTNPIAYTVTATFTYDSVAKDWLDWLQTQHIADVVKAGATSGIIVRLDREDAPGTPSKTYEVQYRFENRGTFEKYIDEHAPRLRAESRERFPPDSGIHYRRSVGEIIEV